MMKHFKLLLAHILISYISVLLYIYLYEDAESEIIKTLLIGFQFITIFSLYILSGYLATKKTKKFQLSSYWIIAIVGICIWLFAFISSSTDLNWKTGHGANWFFYRFYICRIEELFYFYEYTQTYKTPIIIKHIILLSASIIPSALQAFGGYLKHKRR